MYAGQRRTSLARQITGPTVWRSMSTFQGAWTSRHRTPTALWRNVLEHPPPCLCAEQEGHYTAEQRHAPEEQKHPRKVRMRDDRTDDDRTHYSGNSYPTGSH